MESLLESRKGTRALECVGTYRIVFESVALENAYRSSPESTPKCKSKSCELQGARGPRQQSPEKSLSPTTRSPKEPRAGLDGGISSRTCQTSARGRRDRQNLSASERPDEVRSASRSTVCSARRARSERVSERAEASTERASLSAASLQRASSQRCRRSTCFQRPSHTQLTHQSIKRGAALARARARARSRESERESDAESRASRSRGGASCARGGVS